MLGLFVAFSAGEGFKCFFCRGFFFFADVSVIFRVDFWGGIVRGFRFLEEAGRFREEWLFVYRYRAFSYGFFDFEV